LPWSEFFQLHVVKKVAKIVNRRWSLGVGFIDMGGRRVKPPRTNGYAAVRGLCQVIQDRGAGESACEGTSYETLRMLRDRSNEDRPNTRAFEVTCHAGLGEVVAPIVVDGAIIGAVTCGGLLSDNGREKNAAQLAAMDRSVDPLTLAKDDYIAARTRHPRVSRQEVAFLVELLEAATEEIAAYYGDTLRRQRRHSDIERPFATRYSYDAIIGRSKPMQDLYSLLDRIVQSDSTVLVQGENGTGKELVARAIHYNSDRKNRRFVVTNCSAFNDNLLDSELFGHKRGAFTGAFADKQGLFEAADQGTFFLDEIGDMSPALQVKVLRVLQEGTLIPVGDAEVRHVDVRIIAATNRDLKGMVAKGTFREDLYYRINVINLEIPPLRDRTDDVELLVEHFLKKHSKSGRLKSRRLGDTCMDRLRQYSWPGNVRELENEVERLVVLAGDERVIEERLLSARIRQHIPETARSVPTTHHSLPDAVKSLERKMILEALQRNNWNKTRASAELSISRRNLIRLVQKYELEKERDKKISAV